MGQTNINSNRHNPDNTIFDDLFDGVEGEHPISSIVIILPAYNEQEVIQQATDKIISRLSETNLDFKILFVDDGSRDNTFQIIKDLAQKNNEVEYIRFSRNFGKEIAILAGISEAGDDFDALIYMDSDGQHSVKDLIKIIHAAEKTGAEIVFGARTDRNYQSFLQKSLADLFYQIFHKLSQQKIEKGVGDFNLLRPRAVKALRNMQENTPFMKGLVSWVGFDHIIVPIEIQDRQGGQAKSSTLNMLKLAFDALLSFSAWPLRAWSVVGICSSFMALSYLLYVIIQTSIHGKDVPGYATIVVLLLGLGGLQLLSIGILGEYVGRIYETSKNRPRYIISERSDDA